MVFSSSIFIFVFLPISLIGYYLLDRKYRNIFLLLMSLAFYAWGEPKFIVILLGSIFLNYVYALLVDRYRDNKLIAGLILTLMVLSNLAIFFVFKYLNFAVTNVNRLLSTEFAVPNIALPIGISFFTFQAMSYVFDVYRKNGDVQKNPLNVALYIAFFPQLVAGPIVRYETVAREINSRKETFADFSAGMSRFIIGLGKKVIIANSVAMVADRAYRITPFTDLSVGYAWLGSICYTLQILFDFSGYSDMAIGLGRMFGFHFMENFNYPYTAKSITDFWRRWHISLSTWFRDYVYIPLGGSRVSKAKTYRNIFVVWLLTGVWHGASWNYVAWGMFYFVLLIFEKQFGFPDRIRSAWGKVVYRLLTFLAVNFGWVLFRANGLKGAIHYVLCMFGLHGNPLSDPKLWITFKDSLVTLILAGILCFPVVGWLEAKAEKSRYDKAFEIVRGVCLLLLFAVSISYCLNGSYNPFIYFNF